jgi:DnaJ-class molecular chaperone
MKDYYKILNINRDADLSTIKKSYKKLAFKYHPDKNRNNKEEAEKKFKQISEAYSCLSNTDKKRIYDLTGSSDGMSGSDNPFEMFNNIFKMHVKNFMNMGSDSNSNSNNNNNSGSNITDILNNLRNSTATSIPFGGIRFNLSTFMKKPESNTLRNASKNVSEDISQNISQNMSQNVLRNTIKQKPKDLIYSILLNLKDIYNNAKKKIKIERIRKHGDEDLGVCKKEKYDFEINISPQTIRIKNEGNDLSRYNEPGDIVIYTKFKSNKYSRKNDNLIIHEKFNANNYYTKNIYEFILPNKTIAKVKLTNEQIKMNHSVLKIDNLGFVSNDGNRGDCYVILNSIMPSESEFGKDLVEIWNSFNISNISNEPNKINEDNQSENIYTCKIINLIDIV